MPIPCVVCSNPHYPCTPSFNTHRRTYTAHAIRCLSLLQEQIILELGTPTSVSVASSNGMDGSTPEAQAETEAEVGTVSERVIEEEEEEEEEEKGSFAARGGERGGRRRRNTRKKRQSSALSRKASVRELYVMYADNLFRTSAQIYCSIYRSERLTVSLHLSSLGADWLTTD